MEKILVGMTLDNSSIWAGIHALSLAKRMNASVSFLLVVQNENNNQASPTETSEEEMVKKMESLIEKGREDGVALNYYWAYGDYASELINFVNQNKITLLVVASPGENDSREPDFKKLLEKLHHRLDCRIEVVQIKPLT